MSADIWTLEHDLCRCCHAEGDFINFAERQSRDEKENYSDMLKKCFEINVLPVTGTLCKVTYTICEKCIMRLKEAFEFMIQVKRCEEKFHDFYNRNSIIAIKKHDELNDHEDESYYLSDPKEDFNSLDSEGCHVTVNVKAEDSKDVLDSREPVDDIIRFNIEESKGDELPKVVVSTRKDKESKTKSSKMRAKVKTKTKEREKKCDKKRTESEVKKRAHKLKEHNIDHRFKCKACNSMYFTDFRLREHIKTFHKLGELHKCKFCDFETYRPDGLYKHKMKHKTVKDHKCRFCGKCFVRKNSLTMHEKIHTGDKKKVCNECGQAFVQKASLNYHMMKYHPEVKF